MSYFSYNGLGWYDALNVRVEKQFSHGFSAQLNYTFSKYLEATSYLNPGDAGPSKAPSSQDYPNHWSITGIYHFPFGQGQRFLSHVPSVANILVSNRQIAPIHTYQSGIALGFGNAILNCPLSAVPISGKNTGKIHEWFNTSCFNAVASQQLANNLINLSARFGGIRRDSYNSWDAALIKNTRIRESMGLEIRVEAPKRVQPGEFRRSQYQPNQHGVRAGNGAKQCPAAPSTSVQVLSGAGHALRAQMCNIK